MSRSRPLRTTVAALLAILVVAQSSQGAGAETRRFDRHGIAFVFPSRWFVTTEPLSNGVNPVYRFTVGSVEVHRTRLDDGPCLPGVAAQLPPTAVLVYLREALGADRRRSLPRLRTRAASFPLPERGDTGLCGFGRGGRWIPFKASGRAFYLGIYVGPRASASSRSALRRLLAGIVIEPR